MTQDQRIIHIEGRRLPFEDLEGRQHIDTSSRNEVLYGGKPLKPSKRGLQHSPDGHNWGYGGSGPACLAHSILSRVMGEQIADEFYQPFKWEIVAALDDEWEMTNLDVIRWVKQYQEQKEASL